MKKQLLFSLLFTTTFSVFAQTNLVPNGDLENWDSFGSNPDNWGRFLSSLWLRNTFDVQSGAASLSLDIESTRTLGFMFSDDITLTVGKTYVCTYYYKVLSGTFTATSIRLFDTSGVFPSEVARGEFTDFSTTEWKKGEFEYAATATQALDVRIYINGNGSSVMLLDNISVTEKETLSTSDLESSSNKLEFYPNPVKSNSVITFNEVIDVTLTSINGKEILSKKNTKTLEIPTLKSGLYFINTNLGVSKKIIIQ